MYLLLNLVISLVYLPFSLARWLSCFTAPLSARLFGYVLDRWRLALLQTIVYRKSNSPERNTKMALAQPPHSHTYRYHYCAALTACWADNKQVSKFDPRQMVKWCPCVLRPDGLHQARVNYIMTMLAGLCFQLSTSTVLRDRPWLTHGQCTRWGAVVMLGPEVGWDFSE